MTHGSHKYKRDFNNLEDDLDCNQQTPGTAANDSLLMEPEELAERLNDESLFIVDLSMPSAYQAGHIPGAIHMDYPSILYPHDDVACDIPPDQQLSEALAKVGMRPDHHVIAYDCQGCAMASRLLWTLEEIGHENFSLLNGGMKAWNEGGRMVEQTPNILTPSDYLAHQTGKVLATKNYILNSLGATETAIIDARSDEEFSNELPTTDRGGRIPGAIHFNWEQALDNDNGQRLRPIEELLPMLWELGITDDRENIVYCQTHFRSAHTYMLLKILGFSRVLGYAAGYSEWGNASDTPIENELIEDDPY